MMDEPHREIDPAARQRILDDEHLRILAFANLVIGWVHIVTALFPLVYVVMGVVILLFPGQMAKPGEPDAAIIGWVMIIMGFAVSGLVAGIGVLQLVVSRCIRRLTNRTLCMVVAALTCLNIPYGTAIGVATLIVLDRSTIKGRFGPAGQGV